MKIFICWSRQRGKKFAEASRDWLKNVFGDMVDPVISVDIDKGSIWFDDLADTLREARIGLICLTPEAIESPWIHFEAGILAKVLHERPTGTPAAPGAPAAASATESRSAALRIFPFLHGIDGTALKGPLAAYQSTSTSDKDDVRRLVEAIQLVVAGVSPDPVDRTRRRGLHAAFDKHWDGFQTALERIPPARLTEIVPSFDSLFRRKTFNESMFDCLKQGWLERYDAARSVETTLRANQPAVRKSCRRYAADMFDALVAEVSAYAMNQSVLLGKEPAPIDAQGRVAFPLPGIAEACERNRKRIKHFVARLADERQAPFFDEAFQFESSETAAERKRVIHRKTAEMRRDKSGFAEHMNAESDTGVEGQRNKDRCRDSEWDLDRIVYYAWVEETSSDVSLVTQLKCVRLELERMAAGAAEPFLMALLYALRALSRAPASSDPIQSASAAKLIERVKASIESKSGEHFAELRQALDDLEPLWKPIGAAAGVPSVTV
ncbi:MAG TPA: hypothetical protein VGF24_02980 [Vicinamibacterales bacterium]|jgi:hypothetical protein